MNSCEPCERLNWDSAWFGIAIGRVRALSVTPSQTAAAVAWAASNGIACLYALVPSGDSASRTALEEAGFRSVDERLTMRRTIEPLPLTQDARIRRATATDGDALAELARSSHRNTRFYVDHHFARTRCDELYATWILQSASAADAQVLVAADQGSVIGYLSLEGLGVTECRIGLVAVDSAARGRGIGRALMAEGLRVAAAHGAQHILVVTQGGSLEAVSYYSASGFSPVKSETWYHRWL